MGYIKPKKQKKRKEARIRHFETNPVIQDSVNRYPGSFTRPGSGKK